MCIFWTPGVSFLVLKKSEPSFLVRFVCPCFVLLVYWYWDVDSASHLLDRRSPKVMPPVVFALVYFSGRALSFCPFCLGPASDQDPATSASQVIGLQARDTMPTLT
jgi:hypothetical protein